MVIVTGLFAITSPSPGSTQVAFSSSVADSQVYGSGPVSTFPASWEPSCGLPAQGNRTTTIGSGNPEAVNLSQIYSKIINSNAFNTLAAGRSWVTIQWDMGQSFNLTGSYTVVDGHFIFVLQGHPDGYAQVDYFLGTDYVTVADTSPSVPIGNGCLPVTNTSSSSSGNSSTSIQSTANSTPSQQYPLVWESPPTVCDVNSFCVSMTLGFVGATEVVDTSTTTITGSDGNTTIIRDSTTTVIASGGKGTAVTYPSPPSAPGQVIAVLTAYVQDAATGQNVTTGSSQTYLESSCNIQPTGFTNCNIVGEVPSGHTYNVTVFVTKQYGPCSIQVAGYPCSTQLLAQTQTITMSA